MSKPRLLDLFCGAGGAARGYADAGFEVVGVDINPQPNYPFRFVQRDALDYLDEIVFSGSRAFDVIHASPPCQAFTAYKRRPGHVAPVGNLIPAVRASLRYVANFGVSYVIENVGGAPLESPSMLCGSMFGLDVRRHRYFETSFPMLTPMCAHEKQTPRFPPATNRTNLRSTVEVGVWRIPLEVQRRAMGIDWMDLRELSQAIPPAYTRWIGGHLMRHLEARAA